MEIEYRKENKIWHLHSLKNKRILSDTIEQVLKQKNWSYAEDGHGGTNVLAWTSDQNYNIDRKTLELINIFNN